MTWGKLCQLCPWTGWTGDRNGRDGGYIFRIRVLEADTRLLLLDSCPLGALGFRLGIFQRAVEGLDPRPWSGDQNAGFCGRVC